MHTEILVGRPEGKRSLGRPRHSWEDNIKMVLMVVGCMYIWGFRARQHLSSLELVMNEYRWLWWPNDIHLFRDIVGFKLPDICLTKKLNPWRYSLDRLKRMLPDGDLVVSNVLSLNLNFRFLNRISLLLISSSFPMVLTRLNGQVRKNPKKTPPRKLVPTGDRTCGRCVTGVHATACSTAMDWSGCDAGAWIDLPQYRDQWRSHVRAVMHLRIP